jgi:hypothetical protein
VKFQSLLLTIITIVIALFSLEGLLRLTLDPDQLYNSAQTQPVLRSWRNEVKFWQSHVQRLPDEDGFDPSLGWDIERSGDRIRGVEPISLSKPAGVSRIVSVGDSFTFGIDAGELQNFSALLNQREDLQVLNMGVPGYGIDQSYLKYRQHGAKYEADTVLFGIYVGDYERTRLTFNYGPKPSFSWSRGHLSVQGVPLPRPAEEVTRIGAELNGIVYLQELFTNLWQRFNHSASDDLNYFDETDKIVAGILAQLKSELLSTQQLVIIHIPRAEAFTQRDGFRDEASRRLLTIYDELQLNVIDLNDVFRRYQAGTQRAEDPGKKYYFVRKDGSFGHLSEVGHRRVAELVLARLPIQHANN